MAADKHGTNTVVYSIDDANKGNNKVGNDVSREENVRIDLDTILINEIGQFGWFQLRALALAGLAVLLSACHGEYNFTAARINTRCLVPECENASSAEFGAGWVGSALPASAAGDGFDSCSRFAGRANVTLDSPPPDGSCPAHLFDPHATLPCEAYVYQNTHTVAYDFDLACNEWQRSIIGFSRTLGSFISYPLTGFVSDRWGRRTALALTAFNNAWVGLTRFWATNYTTFIALEFLEGMLGTCVSVTAYVLVVEMVGPKYRGITSGILLMCFSIGHISLALLAWAIPDWRRLTLAIYMPQLITLLYFWILTESFRWYMSKGRYEESEAVLKDAARINKRVLSSYSLQMLRVSIEADKKKKNIVENEKAHEPWLPVLVFRHKKVLLRCIVLPIWWITTTLVYYGLSINSVNISGNKYINYITVSAVEIPGFWLSVFLLSRIGRKPVLMGAFWVCAACQAAYIFIPNGNYVLSLAVYLLGKLSIACVGNSNKVYTTEVFPTKYRHRLYAFSGMIGRIGAITAPLTPAIGAATFEELPFVLFGSFALISGALVLLMPETLGCKLPDTMEEAEVIGRTQDS